MNWKKIVGAAAIIGLGIVIYSQYKKSKEKQKTRLGNVKVSDKIKVQPKFKRAQ